MPGYESNEALSAVLTRMVALMREDEGVAKAAEALDVSMTYVISDLDAKYHVAFRKGEVSGGQGEDPQGSAITLTMTSEVFDDLLTGAQDGVSLAMTGKMGFSGDTSAGMAMMGIMGPMQKSYKAAREEAALA
jgi:putative sterol carrier protein